MGDDYAFWFVDVPWDSDDPNEICVNQSLIWVPIQGYKCIRSITVGQAEMILVQVKSEQEADFYVWTQSANIDPPRGVSVWSRLGRNQSEVYR